nr:cation:proton antiporter subunit C [Rhabdothermincola salaria]
MAVVALVVIGLATMVIERHLLKKLVGLVIFQTAIFLFFIQGSIRDGADVPVIDPEVGADATRYMNPLPHLLILTALVVGAAVIGVALALMVVIQRSYGTLDDHVLSGLRTPEQGVDAGGQPAAVGETAEGGHSTPTTGTAPSAAGQDPACSGDGETP